MAVPRAPARSEPDLAALHGLGVATPRAASPPARPHPPDGRESPPSCDQVREPMDSKSDLVRCGQFRSPSRIAVIFPLGHDKTCRHSRAGSVISTGWTPARSHRRPADRGPGRALTRRHRKDWTGRRPAVPTPTPPLAVGRPQAGEHPDGSRSEGDPGRPGWRVAAEYAGIPKTPNSQHLERHAFSRRRAGSLRGAFRRDTIHPAPHGRARGESNERQARHEGQGPRLGRGAARRGSS